MINRDKRVGTSGITRENACSLGESSKQFVPDAPSSRDKDGNPRARRERSRAVYVVRSKKCSEKVPNECHDREG